MPLVNVRSSKANARNDMIIVAQGDGDVLISSKIRTEFSRLHEDEWQMSFPMNIRPVLVYRLNKRGRKAIQKGRIYPFLEDTRPADHDPRFVHRMLPQIVADSEMGQTKNQRKEDSQRTKINNIAMILAAFIVVGTFLKVWMG